MFKTKEKSQERMRQISLSRFQRNKVGRKSYHELKNSLFLEKGRGTFWAVIGPYRKIGPIRLKLSAIIECVVL
jgi:hypothetical protein